MCARICTGVRLVAKKPLDKDREVTLLFDSPLLQRPIKAGGRVAWCRSTASGFYSLGINLDSRLNMEQFQYLS